MADHILFLTGKLAEPSLVRVLGEMQPAPFTYEVRQIGISVAALMTADLVRKRIGNVAGFDRVVVPGRCRGDLDALARDIGVAFERGPEELKDLPEHFGKRRRRRNLDVHDVRIFAEIVDAPNIGVAAILERARRYRRDGADVIDLGCLPDTPFPHLSEAVAALKAEGFAVSIDSLESADLLAGGRAGADYLLSLREDTLWIADEVPATPILIGSSPDDLDSLGRAMQALEARGRAYFADPILDPIHMGFTASVLRYHELRRRHPQAPIMMGTGNLTELTHADSAGVTAILMGIVSELRIGAILTTEVSPHCRRAVREADLARRIMYATRADGVPPRFASEALMALHERRPFPYSEAEVADMAAAVTDPNYRIQVTPAGIHLYNRDGSHTAIDPYDLFPHLAVDGDAGHAFYLGLELARAQIAWQLGKRYRQDEELDWGAAVEREAPDLEHFAPERSTRAARRHAMRRKRGAD